MLSAWIRSWVAGSGAVSGRQTTTEAWRVRPGLTVLEGREVPAAGVTPGVVAASESADDGYIGEFETDVTTTGDDAGPDLQWYNVRLLNPEHSQGDTEAVYVDGGLFLFGELPGDGSGGVYVAATSKEDAIFKAVVGSSGIDLPPVYEANSDAVYDFVWLETHAGTGDERPAYSITPDRIWLEDTAAFPEACDWDYNDWYWDVSVTLVPPNAPPVWKPLSQNTFKTLMDKQGIVKIGSDNYDRSIGNAFQMYVGRAFPQNAANGQAFPTGLPDGQATVTPDFVFNSYMRLRDLVTGQIFDNHALPKGTWGDAKMYKDNIGVDPLRPLIRGLETHRLAASTDSRYTLPRLLVISNADVDVTVNALAEAGNRRVLVDQSKVQWLQSAKGPQIRLPRSERLNWGRVLPTLPLAHHSGKQLKWVEPPPAIFRDSSPVTLK